MTENMMPITAPIAPITRAPELLAPAGDWDAMRAAVANGADAVYFGLDQFNARYRATNFTLDELPQVMAYLHRHNVRGFLTFNTLIFTDELPAAADYIKHIAAAGVDAVIVQDLGLVRLIRAIAPTLHVHGSTQMTLTEPRGIEFVRSLGVNRVVVARELSVEDIRKITQVTNTELEVFIHGALCVAYSGQCLTSESLGGRSANRGQCAQACRLPYELIVDGEKRDLGDINYLLSPRDLAAYDLVDDLTAIGVASFKIEGRLKSAHYVAATSQAYRAAIDAAVDGKRFLLDAQQKHDLELVYSRGLSNGFLEGVNHQALVHGRFPKSRGRRIGLIVEITPRGPVLQVDPQLYNGVPPLAPGDGIVFDEGRPDTDEKGGRIFGFTPAGRGKLLLDLGRNNRDWRDVQVGAILWHTDDPAMKKRLEQSYAKDWVVHRTPIDAEVQAFVGLPLKLKLSEGGRTVEVESLAVLEAAQNYPASEQSARAQIDKLRETPFVLAAFSFKTDNKAAVPNAAWNTVRRAAVDGLIERRRQDNVHEVVNGDALATLRETISVGATPASSAERLADDNVVPPPLGEVRWGSPTPNDSRPSLSTLAAPTQPPPKGEEQDVDRVAATSHLHILARTLEQVEMLTTLDGVARPTTIYCDFEDVRRYKRAVEVANAAGIPIGLGTIRIIKPGEEGWLRQVLDCQPDLILVRNLASISFFQEHAPHLPLVGDYSLNIANELTADLFAATGLIRMVPSYDLNWRQMQAMFDRISPAMFECVVHQHMPMFHMEHCVFAHMLSEGKDYRDCGRPCEKHQVDLRDHKGAPHPLIPDAGCRNTVYNAQAQSAGDYVPKMQGLGIVNFRVELLRQSPAEAKAIIEHYADIVTGRHDSRSPARSLNVLNQLGVTRGTFERE